MDGSGQSTVPTTGLSQPTGLAPNAAGDLYVADSGNNRVVKVAAGSGAQSTVPTTGLSSPLGLALDGSGNLYVADGFNNRVVRVRESGGGQVTLAFTGLNTPTGLAFPPAAARPGRPGHDRDL